MTGRFKIEYKTNGAAGRQRLENVSRQDLIEIVSADFLRRRRLPSKVWRRVDNQWRLLSLAAFADLFN